MAASVNGHANGLFYPYPTTLELEDKPIDEIRHLKVAVIGAGLSGITAGILLPAKVPGIEVTILEKNADVVRFTSSLMQCRNVANVVVREGHGSRISIRE